MVCELGPHSGHGPARVLVRGGAFISGVVQPSLAPLS